MAKKRKKKQSGKQPSRPAQPAARRGDTRPKSEKKAAPSSGIKRWIAPIALALVVIAGLIIAQALIRQDASRPTGPWTLTILHTTDVGGFIDPCG